VHEASAVVDHGKFQWSDQNYRVTPFSEMIFYEAHIGTLSDAGTFAAAVDRLDYLLELGINTLEIMPVAQFPGSRNWGYDSAYLYAVQNSYGGPEGLKYLINECHKRGLAVCLDVVYNHLGPEGNYLSEYCPYFTHKYQTPWGQAVNFDDAFSYGVREFVINNVLYWFEQFHVDALRLDAVHGIFDTGAKHILKEMTERVREYCQKSGRRHYLIAESDLNDTRLIQPFDQGGYGLDGQWSDDFHHAVHTLLTHEDKGYYTDFGRVDHLIKAISQGFVYSWDFSEYRQRYHGNSSEYIPSDKFVICIQNHDQVGNRMLGERLSHLVSFEALKLATAVMLTSPYIPLLFMGEEYAEDRPFLYFVSHGDQNLIEAVRNGRKREFKAFGWAQDPPDPQSEETFESSRPDYNKAEDGKHKAMFSYYKKLIQLRKTQPALSNPDKSHCRIDKLDDRDVIVMRRESRNQALRMIFNLSNSEISVNIQYDLSPDKILIDSYHEKWNGPGSDLETSIKAGQNLKLNPYQFMLFEE
jgi:maltooligosyltrehalose trehalohydrolase